MGKILPAPIAERLKSRPGVIADSFNDVTILFADIVNFTGMMAELTPAQIISLLDDIFSAFDTWSSSSGSRRSRRSEAPP